MIPAKFDYVRPGNLDETLAILKDREGEAKLLLQGYEELNLLLLMQEEVDQGPYALGERRDRRAVHLRPGEDEDIDERHLGARVAGLGPLDLLAELVGDAVLERQLAFDRIWAEIQRGDGGTPGQ